MIIHQFFKRLFHPIKRKTKRLLSFRKEPLEENHVDLHWSWWHWHSLSALGKPSSSVYHVSLFIEKFNFEGPQEIQSSLTRLIYNQFSFYNIIYSQTYFLRIFINSRNNIFLNQESFLCYRKSFFVIKKSLKYLEIRKNRVLE